MAVTNNAVVAVLGELFQVGKRPNTFLRLIGGIQGGVRQTASVEFPTNVLFSLRAPSQAVALEGANAPGAQTVSVAQSTNVVQLIHETVAITYLAQSNKTVGGVVPIPQAAANGPVQNPRSEAFQVAMRMETIAQDLNFSFLNGAYINPADASTTALKTRGILTAISTNVIDGSADAVAGDKAGQLRAYVEALLTQVVNTNGFMPDDTWTIMAGTTLYTSIAAAYGAKGTIFLTPESEYAGVKIRRILTNVGILNLALDPDMPANEFAIFDLSVVQPVGLDVPGKGILFMEPLAKTGSSDLVQIYGQMGLDHGPEFCHGLAKVPAGFAYTN
jgi:hypothetical protein